MAGLEPLRLRGHLRGALLPPPRPAARGAVRVPWPSPSCSPSSSRSPPSAPTRSCATWGPGRPGPSWPARSTRWAASPQSSANLYVFLQALAAAPLIVLTLRRAACVGGGRPGGRGGRPRDGAGPHHPGRRVRGPGRPPGGARRPGRETAPGAAVAAPRAWPRPPRRRASAASRSFPSWACCPRPCAARVSTARSPWATRRRLWPCCRSSSPTSSAHLVRSRADLLGPALLSASFPTS